MRCPYCGNPATFVLETRQAGNGVRRRRECKQCHKRFTTYEQIIQQVYVVKSDNRREPFSRDKLLHGIRTACAKRPISSAAIEGIVDQVQEFVLRRGRAEISSKIIGNMVLEQLKPIDAVAYIRFASVYLDLPDLAAVQAEIDRIRNLT